MRRHIFKSSNILPVKAINHRWFLFTVVILISISSDAQTDSAMNGKAQFKLGLFYNSGLNYYGRTDSLRSSGIFPIAELQFNNFYINAAPVFVNNKTTSLDYGGTVATIGFRFSSDNKYAGNIYFVKPFYEQGSHIVQSALKAQLASSFSILSRLINITAGADVKFSDKFDYGVMAGLDHIFRIELPAQTVMVIAPSAYVNAGTQQFTKTYYEQSGLPGFPDLSSNKEVSKFNILSYELSVPVILAKGKVQLLAIPSYVLPQNLINIPGRPDLSERGREMFYATLGARLSF